MTYDPAKNSADSYREAIAAKRANATCEVCGCGYYVRPYRLAKTRFCSQKCGGAYRAANSLNTSPKPWAAKNLDGHRHKSTSRFKPGQKPWNKNLKGIHLSPETEFKSGRTSEKFLPFGTTTIRPDKNGNYRAWVKCADGLWKPRAVLVCELRSGPLGADDVVHHIDRDTLNDRPSNLVRMTRAQHIEEHRADWKSPEPQQEALEL